MTTSVAGVEAIKKFEGLSLQVYGDNGHPCVGYGHDLLPGESYPDGITQEQAEAILTADLLKYESAVNEYQPFTQGQFDALVSFAYNLGIGSLRMMMAHGKNLVPTQIPRWNHINGVVNANLSSRREAEVAMWLL